MLSAPRLAPLAALLCVTSAGGLAHRARPAIAAPSEHARVGELRVCADPNNLPFSNDRREGFENAIAEVLARDLGWRLTYHWLPQRRGFLRNSLRAGLCDVVMALPAGSDMAATTQPYYRSTYVFISRADRRLQLGSMDSPLLKTLRIGVQLTGDDYNNPPAAQALASRHLIANVRGYTVYGDYSKPEPQREIVDAVARGDLDTAVVWGPVAGYFAAREPVPMSLSAVAPAIDRQAGPFVFDISLAVRRQDTQLHQMLELALARERDAMDEILRAFGVPLVARPD
jgi:mxaJ protein